MLTLKKLHLRRTFELNSNLLIVGAGQYGMIVYEIARSIGSFDRIDFLDDNKEVAVGKLADYEKFSDAYHYAIAAIGNTEIRKRWTQKLEDASYNIPVLISPKAYVSPSASLEKGVVVEPMAVVHARSVVGKGSIISANATVNHNSECGAFCHVDCGAVVASNVKLPDETNVTYGVVFL